MNVDKTRDDFPILQRKVNGKPFVYLDSACTSLKPKQVVDAVASPKKKVLDKVVLIEFPQKGSYCLAFVTSRENKAISKAAGSSMISVFLPKVPNPASGFLLYVPASKVVEVDMSMETALKLIMSAGVVTPDKKEPSEDVVRVQDLPSLLLRLFKPPKKEFHDPRD